MEFHPKAFDVETAFATAKKKQTKKFRGPDSFLYTAICPVVYIIRIFGLAPYGFCKDRLVPSNFYLIFSIIFQVLYSYIIYAECYRFLSLNRETLLLKSTEYIKIIVNYCMVTHDILMTVWTRQKFTYIWNSIQDYDDAVRILGYPEKETKTRIACWLLLMFNTILWIAVNRTGMIAFEETWTNNMTYMSVYIGSCVAIYKFVGITFLLGQRFCHLKEMAQECLPSKNRYCRSIKIDIKTIQGLHNELMIVGENLSSLYSLSLLLWLANLSIHSVANLYFIIDKLINNFEEISWIVICCMLIWVLAFTSQLFAIHIACDFTSSQANSIGQTIFDWQIYLTKESAITKPVELNLHFLGRRLQFSAMGCFYVDLPLMRSIAASITTYLVILLQLQ